MLITKFKKDRYITFYIFPRYKKKKKRLILDPFLKIRREFNF